MREVYEVFGEVLGILRAAKTPVVDRFLGGSRGAGVGRPDSDLDVCILVRKADTQRDTTDVGAMLNRVEALSEAVSMAANAVRDRLEAERRRAANLLPKAPASTYTQARIGKLEEMLALLDAIVKGEPKCRTRL